MRMLAAFALRLAGCALFVPWGLLVFLPVTGTTLLWAAGETLVLGPDEARTDRILLNPAVCWVVDDGPFRLFKVAARMQAKATRG